MRDAFFALACLLLGGCSAVSGTTPDPDDANDANDANDAPLQPETVADLVGEAEEIETAPEEAVGPPSRVKKALFIGIDGLRPDALAAAPTPNLDALAARGRFTGTAQTGDATWSGPGWATLLTGVWRDKHGVADNSFDGARLDDYPDLFVLAESARPELDTVSLVGWQPLETHLSEGADEVSYVDYSEGGDDAGVLRALELLGSGDADLMFLYFGDVDATGHNHGFHPTVRPYIEEISSVDSAIGTLIDAIDARPTRAGEDWLIMVSTDHGGTADGRHGLNIAAHRTVFILAAGTSVTVGELWPPARPIDVAPTLLAHLEIPLDPAWDLDGVPLALTGPGRPPPALGANLLVNPGGEIDRAFAAATPDGAPSGWSDDGQCSTIAYGSPGYPSDASPGPPARGQGFFAGGGAARSTMRQVVDLTALTAAIDANDVDFTLSGWLGGYAAEDDHAQVTVAYYASRVAAEAAGRDKAFFFRGGEVVRYDVAEDALDLGYPRPIDAREWPGLWRDGIDAAVRSQDKVYFFHGAQVLRFDLATHTTDAGFPQRIDAAFAGLESMATSVDAAFDGGNGKAYLFAGGDYIRLDLDDARADPGYPRAIGPAWPGLFSSDLDAAINWMNGKAYVFQGARYARYDLAADATDGGYPKEISPWLWPGVWRDGVGAALFWEPADEPPLSTMTIGPVTADDRGDITGLLERSATGRVPPGSRFAVVTVEFTRLTGTVADGYADELSLRRGDP